MALGDYLSGDQRNAYEALNNLFSGFGLQSLAPKIYDYITKGYSADTIGILLQDTSEYKQRFAGNEQRKRLGLPVLSPSEYLSVESSYRQIMRQGGMPEGFYDQPVDFNGFIGRDVSPSELKQRVDLANEASTLADFSTKETLRRMGIEQQDIAAYFLDESRAAPILQKKLAAAQIGAEALKRGLGLSEHLEDYALAGYTQAQAAQAYSQIAMELPDYQKIASQYGEQFTQNQFEHAIFETATTGLEGSGEQIKGENPAARMERLASWNRARAGGARGGAEGGLARSSSGMV